MADNKKPTTATYGGYTINLGGSTQTNSPTGTTTNTTPLYPTGLKGPIGVLEPQGPAGPMGPPGSPSGPGPTPSGLAGGLTEFGTNAQTSPYTAADAWSAPHEQVPVIKQQLVEAGLLSPNDIGNPAVMDPKSAAAYTKVLEFANTYGMTSTDALRYWVSNPVGAKAPGAGGSTGTREPTVALTNPADIAAGYRNVSASMTGQQQSPAAFTNYYQGLEQQAATQHGVAHAGAKKGSSGYVDYTRAPAVQDAAQQYLLTHDPQDVMSYGIASRMNDFLSMVHAQ